MQALPDRPSPGSATEVPGNGRSTDTEVAANPNGPSLLDPGSDTVFDNMFAEDEMSPEPMQPEPQSLDSVPDLTSPELDFAGEEQDETDILEDRQTHLPTVRPHTDELPRRDSSDTGILEAATVGAIPADERISLDELSPYDDDETGMPASGEESERITNKVELKRDVDPRASDPNAVVRDTVNFYNQTQSLYEKRGSGFPTISPTVVNSTQPLGLRKADGPAPDLFSEPDVTPMGFDDDETLELTADATSEDIDQRETDKFRAEDRQPPELPKPEGTDKIDKQQMELERDGELEPLADEKVAGGRDTQRFYVAEILAQKQADADASSDSTADLQPAHEGRPRTAASSDTAPELATESGRGNDTRREPPPPHLPKAAPKKVKPDPRELPKPAQVNTDFVESRPLAASNRIIPEIDSGRGLLDDDDEPEKITDKLHRPATRPPVPQKPDPSRRAPPARPARTRVTDGLSARLKQEREETLRLIEQAEAVAVRLREASAAASSELLAVSSRRQHVPQYTPEPEPQPQPVAVAQVTEREPEPEAERPSRVANRVSTRAIGELIHELEQVAEQAPASLSALLEQVSKGSNGNGNGHHDDDVDLLVAASSRLRETIESAREDEVPEPPQYDFSAFAAEPQRPAAQSNLSADLDRLWQGLDSRRTSAVSTPTVVIPSSNHARITPRHEDSSDGWSQETLWPTMAGIAVVTFALGALFVWVLVRMAS